MHLESFFETKSCSIGIVGVIVTKYNNMIFYKTNSVYCLFQFFDKYIRYICRLKKLNK